MAGSNSQKELLTLIRDFASEKSLGERRVVNHKKQIEELQEELESENLELEEAKRLKEGTEQEIRGYEVELAMNESSIQALEARISLIQDEISTVGSDLEALKNEEWTLRDDFIGKMFDLNAKIRKFHQSIAPGTEEACSCDTISMDEDIVDSNTGDAEQARLALENKISQLISETNKGEQLLESERSIHMQVEKELDHLKRRISLMESITKESNELQQLSTSKLEQACASLVEELQKKCICPSCHCDNVEMLGGLLQMNTGT